MSAFNIVRFRVKPEREEEFVAAHRAMDANFTGMRRAALVRTGDRAYCFVGEWDGFDSIVSARPQMVSLLDRFRDALEDLGNDLGVTDPVSGTTVVELMTRNAPAKRRAKPAKKAAKKAKAARKPTRKAAKKKAAKKRGRR